MNKLFQNLRDVEYQPDKEEAPERIYSLDGDRFEKLSFTLYTRALKAKKAFFVKGKRQPEIPTWVHMYQNSQVGDEFLTGNNMKIHASVFQLKVEEYLDKLDQAWDFLHGVVKGPTSIRKTHNESMSRRTEPSLMDFSRRPCKLAMAASISRVGLGLYEPRSPI